MIRIQFAIVILVLCVVILTVAVILISNTLGFLKERLEILEEERARALDQPHPPNRETDSLEQFAKNANCFIPKEAYCAGGCGKMVPYLGPESHLICRACLDKSTDKILHHSV